MWKLRAVINQLMSPAWPPCPALSCGVTESMCLRHIIVLRCCRAPHCRVGLLRVCASGTPWRGVAAVPHTVVWGAEGERTVKNIRLLLCGLFCILGQLPEGASLSNPA